MTKLPIHVDLDGVMADFTRGFREISGGQGPTEVHEAKMWDLIMARPNFWQDLKMTEDAQYLWDLLKGRPNVSILTCPSLRDYARAKPGKLAWVQKHLGDVPVNFRHAQTKADFAAPGHILIDDWGKNIKAWVKAGGTGVHHKSAISTIQELVKLKAV